jgi:carbonic anhydrase/acetyltransferase-like protein (isoleucine patch superfamily)
MRKFVINDRLLILPFNEPASELAVLMNGERAAPLALHLTEMIESVIGATPVENHLATIQDLETELARERTGINPNDEVIVYRDNLYFDREFFTYFLTEARRAGKPCHAVLPADDAAWQKYSIPLSSLVPETDDDGEFYRIDLYYFPHGWAAREERINLRVPSGYTEKGYYNVPDSMSNIKIDTLVESHEIQREQDLTHYLTERSCVPIQSWVHLFNASIVLGVFSRGNRFEEHLATHNLLSLKILMRSILEQRQVIQSSSLVKVGRNCDIDPTAVILGPTTIGDNCKIGPGVVIDNCAIGDNVTIANNCHLMLSVVGNNCFLPFRAALFMTVMMDNSIVAQNTCLQMCVIGRNSFIGAGTTFTDFNLLPSPLKAIDAYGEMSPVRQPVIGGGVGHNVRIGAGMVIYPARMIESDVILVPSPERRIISKSITYDMSDHITYPRRISSLHHRLYPRRVTMDEEHMLEEW